MSHICLNLFEHFDGDKLYHIICNYDSIVSQLPKKRLESWSTRTYNPLKTLRRYLALSDKVDGSVRKICVTYRQKYGKGRFTALEGLSLQLMAREIRHTIAHELYRDYDLVNAHPCILRYLCSLDNMHTPELKKYVENREKCLSMFEDREEGKRIYLSLLNSDVETALLNKQTDRIKRYMSAFQEEMKYIHD